MKYTEVLHQYYHLQGFTSDGMYMYWSFTDSLVKTTLAGTVIAQVHAVDRPAHLGGIDYFNGKIYGAVENGEEKRSFVYVYDAATLERTAILPLPACDAAHADESSTFRGAGCITAGIDPATGEEVLLVGSALRNDPATDYQLIWQLGFDGTQQRTYRVPTGPADLGIQNIDRDPETGCYWMTAYDPRQPWLNRETLYCVSPDLTKVEEKYIFNSPYGLHCLGGGRFYASLQAGVNGHRIGYAYEADMELIREMHARGLTEEEINDAIIPRFDAEIGLE